MTHVFHRDTRDQLPYAVGGDGPYVIDADGKRYLDACGGAAVSCLGYNHPAVIEAMKAQLDRIAYVHTAFFSTEVMEELADFLVDAAPPPLSHVYFVSGGSEAMEASIKMARQYFLEIDQPQRRHIIARRQSYHGNTLGALSVGYNAWRRRPFEPLLIETHHIAACYAYRDQATDESETQYGLRVADELEHKIQELGPSTVAAFVAETIVGATAGALVPAPGYFKRIREICDHHGILLILDEVMCGMGRTGSLFACEQEGICGDMIAIAKGLGAGYQPIGALLVSEKLFSTIANGSGFFQHGHTYMGHATACAAAMATQQTISRENLLDNVKRQGVNLAKALRDRFDEHPKVGEVRGRGLLIGLELVADRASKTPFAPELGLHRRLKRNALASGLMCYPMGGTIDGRYGDHVLLAPAFIINEQHVDLMVSKLADAMEATLKEVR